MNKKTSKTLYNIPQMYFAVGCALIIGMGLGYYAYSENDCNCQDLTTSNDEVKQLLDDNNLIQRVQMYSSLLSDVPFNKSNTGMNLSFDKFMNEGGVCIHYAKMIGSMASVDGFNNQLVVFPKNETSNHAIEIISDNHAFCVTSNDLILGCQRWKT